MTSSTCHLVGWHPGAQTISAMRILVDETGCSMSRAKRDIEQVIEGKTVEINLRDGERRTLFRERLNEVGIEVS